MWSPVSAAVTLAAWSPNKPECLLALGAQTSHQGHLLHTHSVTAGWLTTTPILNSTYFHLTTVDFQPKIFLILYISLENSTTGIAILEGLELGTSVDLVQSLGLDISSSSADESSPIKKQQKTENRKKRKRPHLGFSAPTGPETFHSPAKRKNVSK